MVSVKTIGLFIAMIACTVVANVLMKIGASHRSGPDGPLGFTVLPTITGVAFFGAALVIYLWILKTVPLNIAQSFAAAQFIGVILASWAILGEPVPAVRWLGIGLISIGVLLVASTIDS